MAAVGLSMRIPFADKLQQASLWIVPVTHLPYLTVRLDILLAESVRLQTMLTTKQRPLFPLPGTHFHSAIAGTDVPGATDEGDALQGCVGQACLLLHVAQVHAAASIPLAGVVQIFWARIQDLHNRL